MTRRWPTILPHLYLLALLALLTGCRSVPPPPISGGGIVRNGQVAYEGEKKFVAEFIVRQSGTGDFDLELFKGIGAPIFTVRVVHGEAWVGGALAKRNWHGHTDGAWMPRALAGWVGLAKVFARLPATDVPGWKIQAGSEGGGEMQRLQAVREVSGEKFDFRFE